jgi:hypothetical protein
MSPFGQCSGRRRRLVERRSGARWVLVTGTDGHGAS